MPKNYLEDTAKIFWKLNIPEFQSRIYQLYKDKQIYIDTWPNVVGTIKDKTYTGNFQAYKVRNWPFYKDPDPAKASLPPTKPGPGNPLGLFVVHYDENSLRYFHGTNNPKVLNNQLRNLSHGCIRNDNDNIVQTGPKTLLGGLNDGLFKVAYHVGIESIVKIAPINPAS